MLTPVLTKYIILLTRRYSRSQVMPSLGRMGKIISSYSKRFLTSFPTNTTALTCARQYIALRYQLVPYVKRLFQMLQKTGRVVMRPLYFDFSTTDDFVRNATQANDPTVVHQFMFGSCSVYVLDACFECVYLQDPAFSLPLSENWVLRRVMSTCPSLINHSPEERGDTGMLLLNYP